MNINMNERLIFQKPLQSNKKNQKLKVDRYCRDMGHVLSVSRYFNNGGCDS